jgi:serine/threonine protein kinase
MRGIIHAAEYGRFFKTRHDTTQYGPFDRTPPFDGGPCEQVVPGADSAASEFLFRLMSLDPACRPTAAGALEDAYFAPAPAALGPAASVAELRRCCGAGAGRGRV